MSVEEHKELARKTWSQYVKLIKEVCNLHGDNEIEINTDDEDLIVEFIKDTAERIHSLKEGKKTMERLSRRSQT